MRVQALRRPKYNLNPPGIPAGSYRSKNTDILQDMHRDAASILTISALRGRLPTLPYPHLGECIQPGIDFFSAYKGRNWQMIKERQELGYGRRMTPETRINSDVYLGLTFWIEKRMPPIPATGSARRVYGIKDFRDLAHDFLLLVERNAHP